MLECLTTNVAGEAYAKHESPTFVETWLAMEKLLRTGKEIHSGDASAKSNFD